MDGWVVRLMTNESITALMMSQRIGGQIDG